MSVFSSSDIIAKVGTHKLYESQLAGYIPSGLSAEDSVKLVRNYINLWAVNYLFSDLAEKELAKDKLDFTKELEDYRISLLRYKYEQQYMNDNIDTLVSREEIEAYYDKHKHLFKIEQPIVRFRYVKISEDSPNISKILSRILSKNEKEISEMDSLAYKSALKYYDYWNTWMQLSVLSGEFGISNEQIMSELGKDRIINRSDGTGNLDVAGVRDIMNVGETAPCEYVIEHIKNIILSGRRQKLLSDLESKVLNDAIEQKKLVIY